MTVSDDVNSAIQGSENATELVTKLLLLDQKYPGNASVKAQLGIANILNGDFDSALLHLSSAEKHCVFYAKKETRYLIYAGLSDVYGKKEQYAISKMYAKKALALKTKDELGVTINLARAEASLGNLDLSYALLTTARSSAREFLSGDDYSLLLNILMQRAAWDEAVQVYLEKIDTLGYIDGDGLNLSALYEKSGKYCQSLSAAAFELWRLFYDGKISANDMNSRFDELNTNMQTLLDSGSKKRFTDLLRANQFMTEKKWKTAVDLLGIKEINQSDCFEAYSYYITRFLADDMVSLGDIKGYVALEKSFRTSQMYYYHLWQAMKKCSGDYSFDTVNGVLEKTVLLGFDTPMAERTKLEMGRLLGVPDSECSSLMPSVAVVTFLNAYYSSGDANELRPIVGLLSITNNQYTDACMKILKAYKGDVELRDSLVRIDKAKSSLFRLRIAVVFG